MTFTVELAAQQYQTVTELLKYLKSINTRLATQENQLTDILFALNAINQTATEGNQSVAALNEQVTGLQSLVLNVGIATETISQILQLPATTKVPVDVAAMQQDLHSLCFVLLHKPNILGVTVLSQESDMKSFEFAFNLPGCDTNDVKRLLINYRIGDNVQGELEVPPNADPVQSPTFVGQEGEEVTAYLDDRDQAGNSAKGDSFTWIVVDQIPPATPGTLSVVELRQVANDTPSGPVVPPAE